MKNFFAKLGLSVLAVMLMVSSVFAGNFMVGVEYSNVEQDLDGEEVNLVEELVTMGYKINDNFTPYILFGNGNLSFTPSGSNYITVYDGYSVKTYTYNSIMSDFKEDSLIYGTGINGNLIKFINGINIAYDANIRWMKVKGEVAGYDPGFSTDEFILLPGEFSYPIDFEYRKITGNLIISKEFVMNKEVVKPILNSITPFAGIQVSQVAIDGSTVEKDLTSAILGAEIKIKDNWLLKVNALVGDEKGYTAKVSYLF